MAEPLGEHRYENWNTLTHTLIPIWCTSLTYDSSSFVLLIKNSLTLKLPKSTVDDKIFVCKFSKNVKSKLDHIERSNSVDLDEVAHDEPPHQDLRCLQIQLFSSLVLTKLKLVKT